MELEINKIYCCDALSLLNKIPDNTINMSLTSPPYDSMVDYTDGETFDFEGIARELYRVTKDGGIVVWVVGDGTEKGSETLTSFRQAIFFNEIGFNIHDTMIYEKSGFSNPSTNRYHQVFEYMFVLSKGKPKTFNPIKDRENKYKGICGGEKSFRADYGMRYNIWRYANGGNNTSTDKEAFKHPAPFPEALANDHILSWSNPGDLVMDIFMGSGTTAKAAILNNRQYIGCDISQEYCELAEQRITNLNAKVT